MYDTYIFSSQNEPLGLTFFCIHQQWVATKIIFYKPLQGLSVDRYLGISPNYTTQQYLKAQNIYVTEKKCCSSKLGEFYKCLVQKCIKMRHVKRKKVEYQIYLDRPKLNVIQSENGRLPFIFDVRLVGGLGKFWPWLRHNAHGLVDKLWFSLAQALPGYSSKLLSPFCVLYYS